MNTGITQIQTMDSNNSRAENWHQILFEYVRDGIFILTPEGNFIDVNTAACSLLGYSKDAFLTLNFTDVLSEQEISKLPEYYEELLEKKYCISEWELKCNDANLIFTEIASQVFPDGNILSFVRDISARKETEEELIRSYEEIQINRELVEENAAELARLNEKLTQSEIELTEMNASKDKFFSIVAHDLKSPFQGLIGFADILMEDFDEMEAEQTKYFIKEINASTKNVYKLIEQLLDWSRIQLGKMPFEPENFYIVKSIEFIMNLVKANAIKKEITISQSVPDGHLVFADEKMINSVFENLISNAIKFTKRNGNITISSVEKDDKVFITVKDTGIGIDSEALDKIFRIDSNHTTKGTESESGTGLGLLLCKELVEKNGGTIEVQSKPGVGTSIIFSLPKGK